MLALFIHSIASLSKQVSEIIEGVEDGPIEATGANRIQTIWFAIVPQVILLFLSFAIYCWDINVRMATIIGFVGCIIVVIAFVVWLMDAFSAYVRQAVK